MKDARTRPDTVDSAKETSVNLMSIVQMLGAAGEAFLAQANLHRQLAANEWQQEKARLTSMFAAFLVGFCCFICLLIFIAVLAILLTWNSPYQSISLLSVCTLYALGAYLAFRRFMWQAKKSTNFLAATRAEMAADLAMIKSKLP